MKLLIRNLARSTTEEQLIEIFSKYGKVQYCHLVKEADSGQSKCFGFMEMPKTGEAKAAMQALNDSQLDNMKIRVKRAVAKPGSEETPNE